MHKASQRSGAYGRLIVLMGHYRLSYRHDCGRAAVGALVVLSVLALAACGDDRGPTSQASAAEIVTGFVTDVEAGSIVELDSLEVEDAEGVVWHFVARGFKGLTPSHLRDHMVQGLPVSVTYHKENGTLVIEEIAD